ncbi:ribonuclease M5 [Liquorilactobacillus sucicola DSM 21376 = JCM 15457]|uniref:Ribonuclease M5 n=1 Tax=Liquorilactobacillus sucicola DSM 21376 = JCM 15457 TaxID=1423806 RepID=A0A023CZM8_9LACO|nr:ribonuclease M5 [Liquorilactobacillus sucicola]KRN07197.1 ribonuclease M5 [Liquorilactobacillus sucicola DSM 21376 = JCM 15457]GAJ27327.1 ribonuclease M5 [Liquorilactobacillus sucicola DSM 21376 = JCM 15457]
MKKIKEVIVVEGKDDTKRIKLAVKADTLETRGSAISEETIEQIALLQETRGVIVFTDPDFSGEKIRKIITREVPGVKHAFLNKKDAAPQTKGSLGVEHASPAAIREALAHLYTEVTDGVPLVAREDLLRAGLMSGPEAKKRRALLGEFLKIGYTNGKQLYNRLNLFQITPEQLEEALVQVEHAMEENDSDR